VAALGRKDLLSSGSDCTVLIAAPDLLLTLKSGPLKDHAELLAFSDSEALRALEVISRRRPRLVAVERVFAATPRGVALINRIKADPTLTRSEIRVVSHEDEIAQGAAEPTPIASASVASGATASAAAVANIAAPPTPAPPPSVARASTPSAGNAASEAAPAPAKAALDRTGTRRVPRFKIANNVEIDINGSSATMVDLSTNGAQVVSPNVLRPNQRLRISLVDDDGAVRCNAVVAWASFEMPPNGAPRYRAGVAFVDAPTAAVDAFRVRHQA